MLHLGSTFSAWPTLTSHATWRHTRTRCDPTERQLARRREPVHVLENHTQGRIYFCLSLIYKCGSGGRLCWTLGGDQRRDSWAWQGVSTCARMRQAGQTCGRLRRQWVNLVETTVQVLWPAPTLQCQHHLARLLKRTIEDTGWHASDTLHLPCIPAQL